MQALFVGEGEMFSRRVLYLIMVLPGWLMFFSLIFTHGAQHDLGVDFYVVCLLTLACSMWVAAVGIIKS